MSILQRLKSETLPWHQQLEQRVDVMRRLQTAEDYRELLSAFFGFCAPLEEQLAGIDWQPLGIDWQERRKIHLLESDLQRLGVNPVKIRRCDQLPALGAAELALGCLYVLEGATLGGQYIEKQLAHQLGITPETGGAFFHSYGERRGEMWNAFREVLVRFATTTDREDRIVHAAKETFQKFEEWLAGVLTAR
jgi:heme oxygenase